MTSDMSSGNHPHSEVKAMFGHVPFDISQEEIESALQDKMQGVPFTVDSMPKLNGHRNKGTLFVLVGKENAWKMLALDGQWCPREGDKAVVAELAKGNQTPLMLPNGIPLNACMSVLDEGERFRYNPYKPRVFKKEKEAGRSASNADRAVAFPNSQAPPHAGLDG